VVDYYIIAFSKTLEDYNYKLVQNYYNGNSKEEAEKRIHEMIINTRKSD